MSDVSDWLESIGLGKYADRFAEHEIDAEVLATLTDGDLREMGLPLGPRKKLARAIAALGAEPAPTNATAAASGPTMVAAPSTQTVILRGLPERRQLTLMFCDLVGSTALSQRLDPEDLREVIRAYQDACTGAIERYDGFVARYMGDGVLAYFGYPRASENDAERAVRSGLRVLRAVAALNGNEALRGLPDVAVRVGIATGPVVVGDIIGEGSSLERAAVGETPNLAARIQSLAAPNTVLVAPATRRLTQHAFGFEHAGAHAINGIAGSINLWRVDGELARRSRFSTVVGTAPTRFVGREAELDLLATRWQQACDGEGQVVLLSGEAGMGKSRILDEFQARLGSDGVIPVYYRCSPYHRSSAFYPCREEQSRLLRFVASDTPAAKLDKLERGLARLGLPVAEYAPPLAALQGLPAEQRYPPLQLTPDALRRRVIEAILACTEVAAARQTVLQVVEDAHWIDPSTLELLARSVEHFRAARVLQVITFRPEFVPPWQRGGHITWLTLNALSRGDCAAVLDNVRERQPLPEAVVRQILHKSDGVPLFVEELTRSVVDAGRFDATGDAALAGRRVAPLTVPETLHDSLMARLDRIQGARALAQLAALLGRSFGHDLIAAVAGLDAEQLEAGLAQLVEAGILYRRGRGPDASYEFKHALVQDVAYESMLRSRRRELHARIAEVLERQFAALVAAEPEVLARHLGQAGAHARAARAWHDAAALALRQSAYQEAAQHAAAGLEALAQLSDGDERRRLELALQVALGSALSITLGEGATRVGEAYRRAHALCEQLGEGEASLQVLSGLAAYTFQRDQREARALNERILELADAAGDLPARLDALRRLGSGSYMLGEFEAARAHLQAAVDLFEAEPQAGRGAGLPDPRVHCQSWLSGVLWHLGHAQQASAHAEEALAHAQRLGHPRSIAQALSGAVELHQLAGDPGLALQTAESLSALARESGFPFYAAKGRFYRGWALAVQGRHEEGIDELLGALAAEQLHRPYLLGLLAEAYLRAGRHERGIESVQRALQMSSATGGARHDAELHRLHGELLLARDAELDTVRQRFEVALQVAEQQRATAWALRAALSLARLPAGPGGVASPAARTLLDAILGRFVEGFDTPDLRAARALLAAR